MFKQTIRSCPICYTQTAEKLHTQQFTVPSNVPLPTEYDIVCCHHCHFVYADTPNSQLQYETYYAHHAKYETNTASQQDEQRHEATACYLAKHLQKKFTLLDIGSSKGDLLQKMQEKGFNELTGVDPSLSCTQHMLEKGIKSFTLTLSDLHTADIPKQDCIVLSHVMEHLVHPNDMMLAIKKLLQPQGLVYLEVPDAAHYIDYFFKSFHYFDVEHINHFDKDSLCNLGHLQGFDIVDIGFKTIPVSQTVAVPAVYILLKNQQIDNKTLLKPCLELKTAMEKYIQLSNQELNKNTIDSLACSQEPIILWGVGSYAQNLLQSSNLKKCNIVAIVDKDPNKQGLTILDKLIHSPASLLKCTYPSASILIASIPFANDIAEEIAAMGIPNPILIA